MILRLEVLVMSQVFRRARRDSNSYESFLWGPTVSTQATRVRTNLRLPNSRLSGAELRSRRSQGMFLLPPLDLLHDRLPDEIADPIVVVVGIDNPHEVLVVTAFDPTGY